MNDERRPIVWAIQNTKFLDTRYSPPKLVSKYDISSAEAFGDVTELLRPEAKPEDPHVIAEIHRKLARMRNTDYLLLIGNPVLIGIATAIAGSYTDGIVNMLQWRRSGYYAIRHQMFPK